MAHRAASRRVIHVLRVFLICLGLWAVVVGGVWAWRGLEDTLTQIALFFTKAAFVTFGGAYAVLSYITDVAASFSSSPEPPISKPWPEISASRRRLPA
jgi:hypothetical protein